MYYRRRIFLAFLELHGRGMEKVRLQKLLFLFSQNQEKPAYHFVPCKYGCYSFQAAEDARILSGHYGFIQATEKHYSLTPCGMRRDSLARLDGISRGRMEQIYKAYGKLSKDDLIYRIYETHPFYAINSKLLGQAKFKPLRAAVQKKRPEAHGEPPDLYTIGYEGISIEQYVTRLMEHCVSTLLDVRRNPFSMKFGFSKAQLQRITRECGIEYRHFPMLGIESGHRKGLETHADYKRLFAKYRRSLARKEDDLDAIEDILRKHARVALTCFEQDHAWCHRTPLAAAVQSRYGIAVEHL